MKNFGRIVALSALVATALASPTFRQPEWKNRIHHHGSPQNSGFHVGAQDSGIVRTFIHSTTTMVATVTLQGSPDSVQTPAPGADAPPPSAAAAAASSSSSSSSSSSAPADPPAAAAPSAAPAADTPANPPAPAAAPSSPAASPLAAAASTGAGSSGLTVDQVLAIMPSASSCAGAQYPTECATAQQGTPFLDQSFTKYGITTKGAQAAILALIAYESGQLKFNINHGNPGQGTRDMMMPNNINDYAVALFGQDKVTQAGGLDAVLALVLPDQYSFASAAWYLSKHCPELVAQFGTDPQGAWNTYLVSCVSVGSANRAARDAFFTTATKALGVS